MILKISHKDKIVSLLLLGKIGVLPTDTIYGLHGLVLEKDIEKKINNIKKSPLDKPLITLISSPKDLELFDISLGDFEKEQIQKFWPGSNTLIFKTKMGETRSFRLPDDGFLVTILKETGPLISTSANIHGEPFAQTIEEAERYFGNSVDFYVDGGILEQKASSVYKVYDQKVEKLR